MNSPRTSVRRRVLAFFVLAATVSNAQAAEDRQPPTNLTVIQSVAKFLADSLRTSLADSGNALAVSFLPPNSAWIVQGPVLEQLRIDHPIVGQQAARCDVRWTTLEASVAYALPRRNGFLGEREVDRLVTVRASVLATDMANGTVRVSMTLEHTARDTVAMALISRLEDSTIPETRGRLPEEGFFTWFAEPLIMLSAIAVSVYLLFHVRS